MQVQKDDIRDRIVEASLEEFYLCGYEKTSMSAIAQRCNISKSNLYRYFESKETIYEVITAPARNATRRVAKDLTDSELLTYPREKMVEKMVNNLTDVLIKHRKEIIIIVHSQQVKQDKELIDNILQTIIQCFFEIDEKKMPRKFACILANMLLDGIIRIVEENEQEEMKKQISILFQYHSAGTFKIAHE